MDISGTWNLKVNDNKNATFIADVNMVRAGDKVTFEQRFEHTHQITNCKTNSISMSNSQIVVNGTADNIQNGEMRFQHIPISIVITGGGTLPYSQIFVTQGGDAEKNANGATHWHGTVSQKLN